MREETQKRLMFETAKKAIEGLVSTFSNNEFPNQAVKLHNENGPQIYGIIASEPDHESSSAIEAHISVRLNFNNVHLPTGAKTQILNKLKP